MTLNETIGRRVREERKRRGWSQTKLLQNAGFPVQTASLSRLETGKTMWSLRLIESVASALGVEALDLMRASAHESTPADQAA